MCAVAICNKCGTILNNGIKICPNCKNEIKETNITIKDNKKNISFKKNIETTKTSKNSNQKTIKVKEIPLEVKKVENHFKGIKKVYSKSINILEIIGVLILVIICLFLILNIVKYLKNDEQKVEEVEILDENIGIINNFKTSNNSLFSFKEDNTFYWYEDDDVLDDNYYVGTYSYKSGHEALAEMGYTEEDFINTFGDDIKIDNVYSINIIINNYIEDKNNTNSTANWWYLLIIKSSKSAIGYNKTLDIRYNLTRK